ncbi:hypothetical protein BJV78DRAFT_508399 [Lactifluus subvellereus]|nr:hypothetical protein BJV78DRAFT_508399 [Lactifluus subvellereus]
MDNSTTINFLKVLPNELITEALAMLCYQDLARCLQVCRRMAKLIQSSSLLKYHLELGSAGMEDGPLSRLSIPERRERLKAHIDAWGCIRWSSCVLLRSIPFHTYNVNIAPGGILTMMSRTEGKIAFVQLPSTLRGIPMRQWELSFPFVPHLCVLDPSEDILIVVQLGEDWEPRFHFLSLKTGKPHPLAAVFPIFGTPLSPSSLERLRLVVTRNYVAVLVLRDQLKIFDWKTGQIVFRIRSAEVRSVTFLSKSRILVASIRRNTRDMTDNWTFHLPVLRVYDLDQVPNPGQHQQAERVPLAIFALEFGRDVIPVRMDLQFRLNVHSYSPEVAVPFFSAPTDQLVALHMAGLLKPPRTPGISFYQTLLIPITKLLSHVPTTDDRQPHYIQWKDWGPTGTCRLPTQFDSYMRFRGALSGSLFIPCPDLRNVIGVWDFSRACVAQLRLRNPESVPYIQKEATLPTGITGRVKAAISEDVIVICESRSSEERVHLLVF